MNIGRKFICWIAGHEWHVAASAAFDQYGVLQSPVSVMERCDRCCKTKPATKYNATWTGERLALWYVAEGVTIQKAEVDKGDSKCQT